MTLFFIGSKLSSAFLFAMYSSMVKLFCSKWLHWGFKRKCKNYVQYAIRINLNLKIYCKLDLLFQTCKIPVIQTFFSMLFSCTYVSLSANCRARVSWPFWAAVRFWLATTRRVPKLRCSSSSVVRRMSASCLNLIQNLRKLHQPTNTFYYLHIIGIIRNIQN